MTASIPAEAPLLFFDSGIGGLSVLSPVRALLPQAPIVYAADYAGLPYGDKSETEIAARVPALLGRLVERHRPRLAVIACNTASTIALSAVRAALDIPIVGTVPAVKPAALATRSGVIGLLGTAATIRQPYVDRLEAEFAADKRLIRHAAPALVQAAEAKLRGETPDAGAFAEAVLGLRAQTGGEHIDTVVLACTHFPLVEDELGRTFDRPMTFVHGGEGIARRVAFLTQGQPWPAGAGEGIFVTTGSLPALRPYLTSIKDHGLADVRTL